MSYLRAFKVYCQGSDRDRVLASHELVAEYESFVVVHGSEAVNVGGWIEGCRAEDITPMYELPDRLLSGVWSAADVSRRTGERQPTSLVNRLDRRPHHYVVQFVGPIKKEWLRAVRSLGGELRRPLDSFAYVVRCVPAQLARLVRLKCVRQLGRLSITGRIHLSDELTTEVTGDGRFLPATHVVEFFDASDLVSGVARLAESGAEVVSVSIAAASATIRVAVEREELQRRLVRLAETHGVAAIRPRPIYAPCNDVAVRLLGASGPELEARQLAGRGEVIGICDTGLDSGDVDRIHPDFAGRVRKLISYPMSAAYDEFVVNRAADDGPADVDSGHGTHVAGSAVGSGLISSQLLQPGQLIRGVAYEAELVFQAVEQECRWIDPADEAVYGRFALAGLPDDVGRIFRDAYRQQVRVHSNSWGGGTPGDYDHYCRQLDKFVWDHPDFCVLVAAGNEGTDEDGDGVVNWGSISSPGTAKNCITVGASESVRPAFASTSYGQLVPESFPVPPISVDPVADNWQQVAAFSSRGPTRDGRVKPDVVAPGTYILSTRSRRVEPAEQGWAAYESSGLYCYMGGSSMATPLAAGAVAVIRQYLRRDLGWESPPAALIKAVLLATAQRLEPERPEGLSSGAAAMGGALWGPSSSVGHPVLADCHQGWGLISLEWLGATHGMQRLIPFAPEQGLETGQVGELKLDVESSQTPLRIVLAYSDYPGDRIVNQLELEVIGPDGQSWWGHSQLAPLRQPTNPNDSLDHHSTGNHRRANNLGGANNVGGVWILEPLAGRWAIRVYGANVPRGPQPYALAAWGHVSTS
ncbi:MAG: S8 family serine peptidase [Pirellulales bacterium]